MYRNPAKDLEMIELRKAYVELAQLEAELAATKAESNEKNKEVVSQMAKRGRERSKKL